MNILVVDVAASEGGALSVLNDFYEEVRSNKEIGHNWFFLISTPTLNNTSKITVIRKPWIKKSWFHRIFFDILLINQILNNNSINLIVSLQNIKLPTKKYKQITYIHNCIPFSKYKFNVFTDPLLSVYQKLLFRPFIRTLKYTDMIFVQTKWMKEICMQKVSGIESKIKVIPPNIRIDNIPAVCKQKTDISRYFYPAQAISYKNHMVILKACEILERKKIKYKIIFTFSGNENKTARRLYKYTTKKSLNIEFIGQVPRSIVLENMRNSILLFPSIIESYGLPLVEAMTIGCPILASACEYSLEILENYKDVRYFDPHDYNKLAELLMQKHDFEYFPTKLINERKNLSLVDEILSIPI